MKKCVVRSFVVGIAMLSIMIIAQAAHCQYPGFNPGFNPGINPPPQPGPGRGMGPAVCGPPPPQGCMSICSAPKGPCERRWKFEAGVRGFQTANIARIHATDHTGLNFINELNFSPSLLFGEVYAGIRFPPRLAFNYSFMIPVEDHGHGLLPRSITVGETLFTAGSNVTGKATLSLHRWEGIYYAAVRCQSRIGVLLMGELPVLKLEMDDGVTEDSEDINPFLLGVGAVAEFSPENHLFFKVKAAYTFLNEHSGAYVDGEARYFPDINERRRRVGLPTVKLRPYLSVGYRYRMTWCDLEEDEDTYLQFGYYGPYAAVGVVF